MTTAMKQIDQMRRRAARYLDIEAVTIAPARGVFSLSFDDFPATAWTEAGPILAEHGVKATYYVCGGLADGVNMDRDQFQVPHLQALHAAGHEVGCHTFGHTSALRMDANALRLSLDANAAWIAERLDGHRMTSFAWPFGDATVGAKRVVRERFDPDQRAMDDAVAEGLQPHDQVVLLPGRPGDDQPHRAAASSSAAIVAGSSPVRRSSHAPSS